MHHSGGPHSPIHGWGWALWGMVSSAGVPCLRIGVAAGVGHERALRQRSGGPGVSGGKGTMGWDPDGLASVCAEGWDGSPGKHTGAVRNPPLTGLSQLPSNVPTAVHPATCRDANTCSVRRPSSLPLLVRGRCDMSLCKRRGRLPSCRPTCLVPQRRTGKGGWCA